MELFFKLAETARTGAQAKNTFENFVVSEIFKSHLNAGKTLSSMYFYRGRDGKETDLLIEEHGRLYPVEIKMTGNPDKSMGRHFSVLKHIKDRQVQPGIILCMFERKIYPAKDIIALPITYI